MQGIRSAFLALLVCVALVLAAPAGDGRREPVRFRVSGTPREIGRAVGRKFREVIRRVHPIVLGVVQVRSRETGRARGRRMAAIAARMSAEDIEEIRGVAEGAGIAYEDALLVNLFYSLVSGRLACRQLVAWGPATEDGELIHARNLDWHDLPGRLMQNHNLVLCVQPRDGIEYVLFTWPGYQAAVTGTNRAGISLAFNEFPAPWPRRRVAEPAFFTMKRILRTCRGLEDAIRLVKAAKPMGCGVIVISDSNRKVAAAVEIGRGQVAVRRGRNGLLGAANHATREAGLEGLRLGSADRPVCVAARDAGLPLDVARVKRVLRDRRVLQDMNIFSVILKPRRNEMWISGGRWRAAMGKFKPCNIFQKRGQEPPSSPEVPRRTGGETN